MPTDVGKVGNLVDAPTLPNPSACKPGFREEMVHFACGARALRGRIEQILEKLVRKECSGSEDDLSGSESERSGRPAFLSL